MVVLSPLTGRKTGGAGAKVVELGLETAGSTGRKADSPGVGAGTGGDVTDRKFDGSGAKVLDVAAATGRKADTAGLEVLDVATAPSRGRKSVGGGAPGAVGAFEPTESCLLTCLASMIELTSAVAWSRNVVMIPLALCAGRRRHAYSTNAMRTRLARRRHSSEGTRVMDG